MNSRKKVSILSACVRIPNISIYAILEQKKFINNTASTTIKKTQQCIFDYLYEDIEGEIYMSKFAFSNILRFFFSTYTLCMFDFEL